MIRSPAAFSIWAQTVVQTGARQPVRPCQRYGRFAADHGADYRDRQMQEVANSRPNSGADADSWPMSVERLTILEGDVEQSLSAPNANTD